MDISCLSHSFEDLNPYTASYIPLSRRGADHTTNSFGKERPLKDLKSFEVPMSEAPFRSYATMASASTSRHLADFMDKHNLDEEFQMNLEYLQMMFPGLSYQSLSAVYLENKEDMEATVEMLGQLESYLNEPMENLPETLDICDITDVSAKSKLKNIKDEPGTPSLSSDRVDKGFQSTSGIFLSRR